MSKVSEPSRGQPLDVTFIYRIVSSLNLLWDKVNSTIGAYASLWTIDGEKTTRAAETKIVTGQINLSSQSINSNDFFEQFSYDFPTQFAYPPVVTATPIASDATDAAKNSTVVLTSVSTSRVVGFVKFEIKGTVSMAVNIIAVGVPT